jgi:hypothetical protein
MNIPRFNAEASLYKTSRSYRDALAWGEGFGALGHTGSRVSAAACKPYCGKCVEDSSSPTGCSKSCRLTNCEDADIPCHGCPGGCPPGQTNCGGTGICTDIKTDPNNCGACGNVCTTGICQNGTCGCATPGLTYCNGTCVNLISDSNNCGSCGNVCPPGQSCSNGKCCATGLSNCSGACVNLSNDVNHCGNCQTACPQGSNCVSGRCVSPPPRCPPGCVPLTVACTGAILWCSCYCSSGGQFCPDSGWWVCGGCVGFWQNGCIQ